MYNDENNLYHYTYRKDGSEPQNPLPVVEASYREPWEANSKKIGKRTIAAPRSWPWP